MRIIIEEPTPQATKYAKAVRACLKNALRALTAPLSGISTRVLEWEKLRTTNTDIRTSNFFAPLSRNREFLSPT
jgi:hypothetical protein